MAGIQELKEALKFAIDLGEGIEKSIVDGIGLGDIINLYPALQSAPAAFTGIADVPQEISDLDDEEYEELLDYVQSEFDIEDGDMEEFIEHAFGVVTSMFLLVSKFQELRKRSETPTEG
jgi:hypothetical protein